MKKIRIRYILIAIFIILLILLTIFNNIHFKHMAPGEEFKDDIFYAGGVTIEN
jgi:hypothetical protein